jgi:hypothetical protein
MNSRIVLPILISTLLLLALVVAASAQARTVGVNVGDKFTYSGTVSWSSNDPSATPSSGLVDANNTQWSELTVTAISATIITGQITTHYKNGTEITMGGWVDVSSGNGQNITDFVISANLVAGDSVYYSSQYITVTINETVPRIYSGVKRQTNHLNITSSSGTQSSRTDYYWDKSTGVVVEVLQETTDQTGAYTTTSSEDFRITNSNVWTVPEFPTWTSTLLILIALTSATIVIARKKQPKKPLR